MIYQQNEAVCVLPPLTYSAAGTALMSFDRSGFDYCELDVLWGAYATNAATHAVVSITENDTTVVSNFATFTGSDVHTAWASATLGGSVCKFQLDLRKRKRYLAFNFTCSATTVTMGAIAKLTRAGQSHDSATEQSVTNIATTNFGVSNITRV